MKSQTDSEIVLESLKQFPSATARDLVKSTELSASKVSAAIHHLISSGKAFQTGEVNITASRKVNLYSITPKKIVASEITAQTWFSALMQ